MYSINSVKNMEVIDINSGCRLGCISDLKIDCESYKVLSIIIPIQRNKWFNKNSVLEIPWEKIYKVGIDVILVEGSEIDFENSN
ncbi:YlmC/YmxH family sporulation protein [Clostridium sediminicola]|uniref:YlmC/YmxH family sporulation protein n=1 Tax=Clostridium sediminicola TaxID=3114879 RepID=UPI0031F25CA4